jgi:LysR family transcriptional regulator, hydrogen peroxide-inducible genes activator
MQLTVLKFVVAVSHERNFRRAAERCFVTQPALSLAIQKFEDEIGVRLFERSRTEVSVTPIGARVVEQAQRVLDEADKIKVLAKAGRDPLAGTLRLGAIFTVGPYVLPELIPLLKRRAPEMPLAVEENTTANLESQLREGRLDCVLVALPFGGAGIETFPLYDEPFQVLVSSEHPWASRTTIKATELAREKVLLLNSGHCFSNQVIEACPDLSTRGGETHQGNSLETIRNMVASGLGITVMPCSANSGHSRGRHTRTIAFTQPAPSRRVAIAWRKSFSRAAAIEILARAVWDLKLPGLTMLRVAAPESVAN